MRAFKAFSHSVLLITTPTLFAHPYVGAPASIVQVHETARDSFPIDASSYDKILNLLNELENNDDLEEKYSEADLEKISCFVANLAAQGVLPGEVETACALGNDIQELLFPESYSYAYALNSGGEDLIIPMVFYGQRDVILCKGWLHKKWDQVKKFAKKHKKELIIGAAVVVAAVAVVGIVAAVTAGGAAAASAAAAGSDPAHATSDKPSTAPVSSENASSLIQDAHLKSALEDKIFSFKEAIASDQFFLSACGDSALQESGRVAGSLLGHDSVRQLADPFSGYPGLTLALQNAPDNKIPAIREHTLSFAHQEIDHKFSTDYASLYAKGKSHPDFNILSHQLRGERALASGQLHQAIYDFGKTIELNPTSPIPYLERGIAHFGLGEYDHSIADYEQFLSKAKKTYPLSIPEFSLGFAKGLPKGIYESGRGMLILLSDIITHPIQTGGQMWEALTLLSDLARSGEWVSLSEVLAPEIHQLATEWHTIPSVERGELAGYAFGKYGADILIPGALAKATARGLKGAQELAVIHRGLQTAEKTLLLETAANLGSSAKIAEVVKLENEISSWLGEGTQFIRNKAGDPIFLSKDGVRKVRFDFNHPFPHESPHLHFEHLVDGEWQEISRIYPIDVPHK